MCRIVTYDVFISYNRKDNAWVKNFVQLLQSQGLNVFFDEDIEFGADILSEIDNALEKSNHILLIISPNSIESYWVSLESSMSIYSDPNARNKKLIPIILKKIPR